MPAENIYDRLPYPSKFFVQTFPDRLATNATVFGLEPAPIRTCRALELGCGNGSNLIAQAYLLPEARFVGIDLSRTHIDEAKSTAIELELNNVEFVHGDVTEMTREQFGTFDYVVAHGLFSWVPESVRSAVLDLNRELLKPNGVGYISYSAYPGAHYRKMVQQMLRLNSNFVNDPKEKVETALKFLDFLSANTPDRGVYRNILESERRRQITREVSDVFHDDLSDIHQPFYFHEFAALLDSVGLRFLAEAELYAMGTQGLPVEAVNRVESLNDIVKREQYLDMLRGRIFRQTLFVHKELDVDRKPDPCSIEKFLISSQLRPKNPNLEFSAGQIEKFAAAQFGEIAVDQPLIKAVLSHLAGCWPRAIAFNDLVEAGRQMLSDNGTVVDDIEAQEHILRSILWRIALSSQMVELHLDQNDAVTNLSPKPRLNRLARWQKDSANNVLSLFGIDMQIDDAVSRHLLLLLDGTKTRNAIFDALGTFIRSAPGVEDRKSLIRDLPDWLDQSLDHLARIGMFEA